MANERSRGLIFVYVWLVTFQWFAMKLIPLTWITSSSSIKATSKDLQLFVSFRSHMYKLLYWIFTVQPAHILKNIIFDQLRYQISSSLATSFLLSLLFLFSFHIIVIIFGVCPTGTSNWKYFFGLFPHTTQHSNYWFHSQTKTSLRAVLLELGRISNKAVVLCVVDCDFSKEPFLIRN